MSFNQKLEYTITPKVVPVDDFYLYQDIIIEEELIGFKSNVQVLTTVGNE